MGGRRFEDPLAVPSDAVRTSGVETSVARKANSVQHFWRTFFQHSDTFCFRCSGSNGRAGTRGLIAMCCLERQSTAASRILLAPSILISPRHRGGATASALFPLVCDMYPTMHRP